MSTKQDPSKTKTNKKNKKRDWSFYAIIACLVIIAIPVTFLGVNILQATLIKGKPVIGSRFDGDLEPKIEESKLKDVATSVQAIAGVEKANVELKTATVRVIIKVTPDVAKESYADIAADAYNALLAVYPVDPYFKATDQHKMYDLEVSVYNIDKPTEDQADALNYYLFSQSSNSSEGQGSFLTDTRAPEFVEKLKEAEAAGEIEKVPATGDDTPSGDE